MSTKKPSRRAIRQLRTSRLRDGNWKRLAEDSDISVKPLNVQYAHVGFRYAGCDDVLADMKCQQCFRLSL